VVGPGVAAAIEAAFLERRFPLRDVTVKQNR
jgi:hypothetical protein